MEDQITTKKASRSKQKILVIVESPSKARTINKYLGEGFQVKASVGHVKDLPRKEIGIDFENDYAPRYETIHGKEKVLKELKDTATQCEKIVLATDPDREGEAIAWHISNEFQSLHKPISRALFNEITPNAVRHAVTHARDIDYRLVQSQQARQGIDKIVGYKVSPFLWKTVLNGLSAGRVQSVALRLLCERQAEIDAFVPVEYWSIVGEFLTENKENLLAKLSKIDGKDVKLTNEQSATNVVDDIKSRLFSVSQIRKREQKRNAPAPFITSTLQQAASNKLGFGSKRTMAIAQQLYEGIAMEGETIGLITYMRTDSKRINPEAKQEAKEFILKNFGENFVGEKTTYKTSKNSQDAHEAIRPTSILRRPQDVKKHLDKNQYQLYELIWQRFLASQMAASVYEQTSIDIQDDAGKYLFRASGRKTLFEGFLKVFTDQSQLDYEDKKSTREDTESDELVSILPEMLKENDKLKVKGISQHQHFTKPPARYSDASLVKELDNYGIGRPSTYASILSTLTERGYVENANRRLTPTELGKDVNRILVANFSDIFNVSYTAKMESNLDKIASGEVDYIRTMDDFYKPFAVSLHLRQMDPIMPQNINQRTCPTCQEGKLVTKWTKRGKFTGCSRYPACNHIEPSDTPRPKPQETIVLCHKCEKYPMVLRKGRFGEFLGCSGYTEIKCEGVLNLTKTKTVKEPKNPPLEIDIACPKCKSKLHLRSGKRGLWLGCSKFPKCRGRKPWSGLTEEEQKYYKKLLDAHEQSFSLPIIKTTEGTPLDFSLKIEDLIVQEPKEEMVEQNA